MPEKALFSKYMEELSSLRRSLHRMPEPSGQERQTGDFVYRYLCELHPDECIRLAGTGVKAVFLAQPSSKTIAFRADMDALPIQEQTGARYASTQTGWMHACGHDAHMAIMLCLARLASQNRKKLKNNLVFLFEPAEETDGGALPMIEEGALVRPAVDEIYGLHVWPGVPAGKIGLKAGALMAGLRDVDIIFQGKSAHAAHPEQGIDALTAAAEFICKANEAAAAKGTVLTFGTIRGGQARNIVCETVRIEATIRSFDDEVADALEAALRRILLQLEDKMGVQTCYSKAVEYPVVRNDGRLVDRARSLFQGMELVEPEPEMLSEDFSQFQKRVPGLFLFLGTRDDRHPHALHTPKFDLDERILLVGLKAMARLAEIDE